MFIWGNLGGGQPLRVAKNKFTTNRHALILIQGLQKPSLA